MKRTQEQPLSPYLDEREQQIHEDYEWCLHDPEVCRKYGGKVVVAYRRRIWGAGKNHVAAWTAAAKKRGCPPREAVALVVVPELPLPRGSA